MCLCVRHQNSKLFDEKVSGKTWSPEKAKKISELGRTCFAYACISKADVFTLHFPHMKDFSCKT